MSNKKSRYRPLYKKFIRLRKNIQNRKKLLTNFEKKKWENLIGFLRTASQRRKKNFGSYDHSRFFIPKHGNSFKRKFLNDLLVKQRFSLFYGKLQNKKIKSIVKKSKSSVKSNLSAKDLLVNSLENRLDTVLYRAHFVKSLREARLFIQHKHVSVNKTVITNNAFALINGDIITLSNKSIKLAKSNVYNSNLWPLPPEFLQINYSILQISFIENLYKPTVPILYPFWLDLNTIMNYYR